MQEAQIIPRATTSRPWAKEEPLTVKLKRPRVYAELWQHFLSAYSGSYTCHPPQANSGDLYLFHTRGDRGSEKFSN